MRWRQRRFTKARLFAVLMTASVVLLLVPERLTRPIKNPLQLLAAPQWSVHDAAARADEALRDSLRPAVSADEYQRLEREREALEHQLVALRAQLDETNDAMAAVAGWRQRGLPGNLRLIPARVVSADAVGWHEARVLDRGTSDGVAIGDWVVTQEYAPSEPGGSPPDGHRPEGGPARLLRECLLGQIAETAPLTSRVVFLSDSSLRAPMRVRLARVEADRLAGPQEDFALYGQGNGRMTIPDVRAQLVDVGNIRVGDLVVSTPGDPRLPISMVVGQVERIERDRRNALLVHLFVAPRVETQALRRVFVVSATPPE